MAVPVGQYLLKDDNWWQPQANENPSFVHTQPQMPKNMPVEKLRRDLEEGGSIHHLENTDGIQVAMIGSRYFIKEFWGATETEMNNVKQMLERLYQVGIYAFPCYSQHHAIVFYTDLTDNQLITPQKLAQILVSESKGGPVLDILKDHASSEPNLISWARNYTRVHSYAEVVLTNESVF